MNIEAIREFAKNMNELDVEARVLMIELIRILHKIQLYMENKGGKT